MATVTRQDIGTLGEQAEALRRLHLGPRPLVLPNAWDVASARLVVKAGFPAVATSSGAITAALGFEDTDSMPVAEAFGAIARITRSLSVPVTADVEAGYGLSARELIGHLLDSGAVGCNLEDTDHHGGGGLIDADEQAERLPGPTACFLSASERTRSLVSLSSVSRVRSTSSGRVLLRWHGSRSWGSRGSVSQRSS
jgi:hypothetical protein